MKTLTWQKPGQQNVAQELIKIIINYVAELRYNLIRFLVAFWKHPTKNTVNYPYHKQDISSLILKEMNFKLTNLAAINEKYGRTMEQLKDTTWEVCTNSCGCSGDCGSNWMRS